jgi:hypothetical protein
MYSEKKIFKQSFRIGLQRETILFSLIWNLKFEFVCYFESSSLVTRIWNLEIKNTFFYKLLKSKDLVWLCNRFLIGRKSI